MAGPKDRPKAEYRAEAKVKFGVSVLYFNIAWTNAIAETGRTDWSKHGPVRKSIR
jgi:hypothetical protein